MKPVKKYLEVPELDPIYYEKDADLCVKLLVAMTNEYIDYRNQVFDGACIYSTMKLEHKEDRDYVKQMDRKIKKVKKFLYKE
jgi:hypothetical protein